MPRITKNKQKTNRKQKKETVSFIVLKKTRKIRKTQKGGKTKLSDTISSYLNDDKRVATNRNLWIITTVPTSKDLAMIKSIKDKIDTPRDSEIEDSTGKVYTVTTGMMKKNNINAIQNSIKADKIKNIMVRL